MTFEAIFSIYIFFCERYKMIYTIVTTDSVLIMEKGIYYTVTPKIPVKNP